jgi:hypothetical protein
MTASAKENSALDRECAVFCRYLIGQEPNEYVKAKYRAAHQSGFLKGDRPCPADSFLVKFASINSSSTKIIDAHTRVFRPFSTIRKKLVLLLAILESCAPTHAYVDSVDSGSIPLLFFRLVYRGLTFILLVLVGVVVILPIELVLRGSIKCLVFWIPRHG